MEHINGLKKQLAQLQPLSIENKQRLDKKFRMEWNFNSNHIEGNTLTYGETELLLIFDLTKGNHELREYEEMKGHDIALKLIYDLAEDKERQLTEKFIREINEILLVRPFYKEAITPDGQQTRREIKIGAYKSFPNSVLLQNGEIFHYPSPAETPAMMNDLMNWYNEASLNKKLQPLEVAAEFHYKFVCIHPFDDGNGRIARLLMNYHLLKNDCPPVIIKTADKKNYLFTLREADTGNIEAFKSYIAEQLIWSYEICIKAGKGESIDEAGDWEKKVEILKKEVKTKEDISIKKNKDLITNIIVNDGIALFNSIKTKLSVFNDLFNENKTNVSIDERKWEIMVPGQIFNLAIENINDYSASFSFSYILNGYKYNGFNTFNIVKTVILDFNEFYYEIYDIDDAEGSTKIQKKYSNVLMEEDLSKITSQLANAVYEKIEKQK